MIPRITHRTESKIIGVEVRTSNELEKLESSARIPHAWKRFHEEKETIPGRKSEKSALGVYTSYHPERRGEYSLLAAAEVNALDNIPDGMSGKIVPSGKYLVFAAKGPMPQVVVNTWAQIWKYFSNGSPFKRAYTVDLEVYDESKEDEVEIHIAII
ncbi:MAG: effector binding domain-containing protein [Ignavibacteriales bacterium]|nr:effector binding domain-containing protein [Ignavibacteriales bacterium]